MKRRYRRYFVILEEEDKGFGSSKSAAAKGYGKIEVKNDQGLLSVYCQNLKKLDEKKESYRLYLIHTKDPLEPTVVDVGPIEVDKNNKGEIIWEFNAENVKGFKKAIDDFDVLSLVVETIGESQRVLAPLVGYIHKEKTDWKPILQRKWLGTTKLEKNKGLETPKNPLKEGAKEKIQEKPVEIVRENQKPPLSPKKEDPKKEEILPKEKSSSKEKLPEKEKIAKPVLEEKPQQEPQTTKAYGYDIKDTKSYHHGVGQQMEISPLQAYIENTLVIFPRVEPFDKDLENYQWWQIPYSTQTVYRAYMPFISHIDAMIYPSYYYYPYYAPSEYQKQFYRYQHYIFGICYDDRRRAKYYVYGIPGKKNPLEQPYKGETGFVYWHASHGQQLKEDGFGYWLIHIDAETGRVEKPLAATEL